MTILTGIGLKTRKAKYKGRRWVGGALLRCRAAGGLFQLRLAEEGRRVSTTNRARSVGLEKGIGSVWNVGFHESNFLFGLELFSLSRLNAPSLVSSNICSLEFSSLFTSISMVGGSSWPFSFQVSGDFSLTVERRWISTLPSDEEN